MLILVSDELRSGFTIRNVSPIKWKIVRNYQLSLHIVKKRGITLMLKLHQLSSAQRNVTQGF